MIRKYEVLKKIEDLGVIAVLRSKSEEQAEKVVNSCMKGGINVIEITFSVPGADKVISNLKTKLAGEDIILGAGTVLDACTARLAILAGAEFIVAPTFDKEVALMCNQYGIPYMPGCMTVNEIAEAMKYGVDVVKLFPGSEYKIGFIKAIKAPLSNVNVMVTGGVSIDNTQDWIRGGAFAVGVGGNLTKVENENYDAIVDVAKRYKEEVISARK
ncbi:MAG: bifunctional 2-keto-4-hydroxyglutarate aldolase/2-keto-3-deoxy-6-phosphogluconate aldolase [Clostridiales bacterium]